MATAIPLAPPTEKEKKRVRLSYHADILWILLNFAFLGVWLYQIKYEGQVMIFDQQFIENGFCNLPSVDGKVTGLHSPTQMACFTFDLSMAAAVVFIALAVWKVTPSWGSTGYLVVHGLAHGLIFMGIIDTSKDIDLPGAAVLAAILSTGAAGIYTAMIDAGRDRTLAIIVSALVDIFFTGLFVVKLQKGVYVLTYVNIVISMCIMMPRVLLVPPTEVHSRLDKFNGPYFYAYVVAVTLMNAVIWIEPVFCSNGFANIGGHVWFDISLFAVTYVGILYAKSNDGSKKKD
ncbi:MAG: hypothetical protein ACI8RD_007265 [Bacillariaceae sp.]|jgi:hypothetical protein